MILVDSTIYIEWLRGHIDPARKLADALQRNEVATCGIVRAEVLRGIVQPVVKERMAALFGLMHDVPADSDIWSAVAEMAWTLDRQGVVLPLTDIAIAVCARQIGATVISTDSHFSRIPNLLVRTAE